MDLVSIALRQRRYRGWFVALAVLILIGSAVWSHLRTPADPGPYAGTPTTGPAATGTDYNAGGLIVVERVIDGDTIVVNGAGLNHEHLRLRGVDAPEVKHPGLDHDAYFGPQARQYLTDKLTDRPVTLRFDAEKRDRYQRMLAYVYTSDTDCVNLALVRDGYAYVDRRFKTQMQTQFEQFEHQARTKKAGLWAGVKDADQPAWRQKWLKKQKVTDED